MEFVPVDAVAEGGLCRRFVIGVVGIGVGGMLVVFLEDAGGVWFGAFHVAQPFAGAAHVVLGHAAVVDQHAFDRGVEAALEPVAVARHRPVRAQFGLEEAEQGSVVKEAFEPEVGAAQPQVRPPPAASGRGRPGVVGVLAGEGAFGEHVPPAFAPCVGRLAPACGVVGVVDAGERIGEPFEFPAGLEAGPAGQILSGVALYVDQASLDARARPALGAGPLDALHAVAYEHVGRRDLREQGVVGGGALAFAPLPGEHLAAVGVDRGQQAPAVHVGAVGHDHVMHHAVGDDARRQVPAPVGALAEVACALVSLALRSGLEQPVEELAQLGAPGLVRSGRRGRKRAGGATPSLGARSAPSVLDHRLAAHWAPPRPDRFLPHARGIPHTAENAPY